MKRGKFMRGFDPGTMNTRAAIHGNFNIGTGYPTKITNKIADVWGYLRYVKGTEEYVDPSRKQVEVLEFTIRYKATYYSTNHSILIDDETYEIISANFDRENYLIVYRLTKR